ncbi:uncharacterized protein LOC122659554 [Telopea speciosissima]|uniref:uncharacterized protein LOC122659554 n=1 Tax=Telopea speciosissima TaxID=54955 RepID=UPI001CC6EE99|nr:uncharacterized protein LOC122659554 [Telopea speciosissima]
MNEDNISIEELDNGDTLRTSTVNVFGNEVFTFVTGRAAVVRRWIYKIRYEHRFKRDKLVVGLGVQWRPSMANPVAVLQFCVGGRCLIFQILHANSIPRILKRFLADDSTTFVGVNNYNDSYLLMRDYGLSVNRIFELGSVSRIRRASMETLARRILGFNGIRKPQWIGRSDWDDWWLTEDQMGLPRGF